MSETEITLARAYLQAAELDPVAALIRSVRDLAKARRTLAGLQGRAFDGSAPPRPLTEARRTLAAA